MNITKLIAAAAIAFPLVAQAQARPDSEIARKAKVIANIAYGMQVHKIKGKNAEDMIIKLAMKQSGDTEEDVRKDFVRNLPEKGIQFGDMSGYGTMKIKSATALFESQDAKKDQDGNDKEQNFKVGDEILKELNEMGATFGYTPGSSSYCGVSFMGLLIVDEDGGTIYEILLTDGGTC